ncbi:MAG: hypothetical protein ACOVPA_02770 [Rubrivivax sp.]
MNEVLDPGVQRAATPPQPLTVIEHAIRSGATADQLERLLELQVRADNHQLELMREKRRMDEEDRKGAAVLAFRRDFAAFRGENIIIPKSKFVDRGRAGSFYQAEYGSVMHMLSPALSKHGFSLRHNEVFGAKKWTTEGVESDIPWVYVTCFLEHKDGHCETLSLEGPPGDLSANTPIQNMQATGSYLKRQSALAITGTATADEDDENKLKPGKRQQQGDDESRNEDFEAMRAAGREKATSGMKALTDWWGSLTAKQRTDLSPDFPGFRKAAQAADAQGGAQ